MMQFLDFLFPKAYAVEPGAAAPQGGGMSFLVMFAVFFIFLYFAVWRPQNKRAREQQNLLGSLAKGDEVITAGVMVGRIVKLNDQYMTVAVSSHAEIVMQKSAVVSVLPKGTLKALE
jgi:preprotein translocase subunit YajC